MQSTENRFPHECPAEQEPVWDRVCWRCNLSGRAVSILHDILTSQSGQTKAARLDGEVQGFALDKIKGCWMKNSRSSYIYWKAFKKIWEFILIFTCYCIVIRESSNPSLQIWHQILFPTHLLCYTFLLALTTSQGLTMTVTATTALFLTHSKNNQHPSTTTTTAGECVLEPSLANTSRFTIKC